MGKNSTIFKKQNFEKVKLFLFPRKKYVFFNVYFLLEKNGFFTLVKNIS